MELNNHHISQSDRTLRPNSIKLWKDYAKTKAGSESFSVDTIFDLKCNNYGYLSTKSWLKGNDTYI